MILGTNLDSVKDYASSMPFADCMRSARAFGSAQNLLDGKATLGADGWPIGDFGVFVFTEIAPVGGVYKMSFNGKATVSGAASSASIQNMVYDAAKDFTTADIVLPENSQMALYFRSAVNVKNLKILRPGCTSEMLFTPAFLDSLKPFKVIRFMDWLRTNGSEIKTWADRKLPTELLQSGTRGVSIEYCAELCNQLGVDGWFNVPHQVDDDYVQKMAEVIKAKLKPELKVYIEYSNEVWNSAGDFTQTKWNYEQAQRDVAAGQKDLSLDGTDSNVFYWGRRRVGKRIVQIGKIFKAVLGADRVRPILANQISDTSVGRAQLQYIQKYCGKPSDFIWGCAGAPYFSTKAHLDNIVDPVTAKVTGQKLKPGSTVQTVLDGLKQSIQSNVSQWEPKPWDGKGDVPLASVAKYYGVNFVFYEMGQHLVSGADVERQKLERGAQIDPQMEQLMTDYLMGMDKQGVALSCYFVHCGNWGDGKYGYWGAKERLDQDTPKSKALLAVASKLNAAPPSEVDLLKAQIASLTSKLSDASASIVQLTKQLSDLTAQQIQSQMEKKNLQDQVSALTVNVQALQSKIDNAKAALS